MNQTYELAVKTSQGDIKSEKLLFSHLFDRFTCLAKLRGWGNDAEDIAPDAGVRKRGLTFNVGILASLTNKESVDVEECGQELGPR